MAAPSPSPSSSSSQPNPSSSPSYQNQAQNPNPSSFLPPEIKTPLLYGTVIISPILLLLPPRKLDLYTFALGGAFVVSARELAFGESAMRQRRPGGWGQGVDGEKEEEVGGVRGMIGRVFNRGGGRSGGKAGVSIEEQDRWRREVELRARERQQEIDAKGYSGVIIGEIREVMGRDRETGERVRKGK